MSEKKTASQARADGDKCTCISSQEIEDGATPTIDPECPYHGQNRPE